MATPRAETVDFLALVKVFGGETIRYASAQIAHSRFAIAASESILSGGGKSEAVVSVSVELREEDVLGYRRIVEESLYVYAVSIFEAFLEDVYRYLVVTRPVFVKDKIQAGFDDIFLSDNIEQVKISVVEKVVRSFAKQGIVEKLESLNKLYKVESVSTKMLGDLKSVVNDRNAIVHSLSATEVESACGGKLNVCLKKNTTYEKVDPGGRIFFCWNTVCGVAFHVIESIYKDVLKEKDDTPLRGLRRALLETTQPPRVSK